MNNNRRCSSCNSSIPQGRDTCPICYAISKKEITKRLSTNTIKSNSEETNEESIWTCLFDISFDKFAILVVCRFVYILSFIITIGLMIYGLMWSLAFYGNDSFSYSPNTKNTLTLALVAGSIFLPLLFLLIVRISMEFSIAVIKVAENSSKILDIVKRI